MEKVKELSTTKKEIAYYTDRREFSSNSDTSAEGNSSSVNKQINTMSLREKIMRGNDGALNMKLREELVERNNKKQKKNH